MADDYISCPILRWNPHLIRHLSAWRSIVFCLTWICSRKPQRIFAIDFPIRIGLSIGIHWENTPNHHNLSTNRKSRIHLEYIYIYLIYYPYHISHVHSIKQNPNSHDKAMVFDAFTVAVLEPRSCRISLMKWENLNAVKSYDGTWCLGLPIYIWVNYHISLTWIKAILGWFPLLTMIIVRSQWGRYNLPR